MPGGQLYPFRVILFDIPEGVGDAFPFSQPLAFLQVQQPGQRTLSGIIQWLIAGQPPGFPESTDLLLQDLALVNHHRGFHMLR